MFKKFFGKAIFFLIIVLTALILPFFAEASSEKSIRVLISRDLPEVKIAGLFLSLRELPSGRELLKNKNSITITRVQGPLLNVKGKAIWAEGFFLFSAPGYFIIQGRKYKGKVFVYPGANRDVWVVNELPLEEYLVGLVNMEISSQWPGEAIKAQVVAARTFAYYQKERRVQSLYEVEGTVNDQVYGGIAFEDDRARKAVKETTGQIIHYHGKPIFAVYHACCGGKTESPNYLWSGDFPYLRSISCGYCFDSPHFVWNYQLSIRKLEKIFQDQGWSSSPIREIIDGERNESGRIIKVLVRRERDTLEIPAREFRQILGYDLLRSTNFWVKKNGSSFAFSGLGWGHGAGLCQWGAKGLAETGADFQSILKYYYKGIEIGKGL